MDREKIAATWSQFVRDSIGERSATEVADTLGISDSTVGNWKRGANFAQPSGQLVVAFARAYRPGALQEAMVAAGYGEAGEYTGTLITKPDISELDTVELAEELHRRVSGDSADSSPKAKRRPRPGRPPI